MASFSMHASPKRCSAAALASKRSPRTLKQITSSMIALPLGVAIHKKTWAREKFVMAVEGEFPRARGAGVPKGTILCLGRVLDAHEEQDDAEGGHRDWEEDPLGFDTNPMLLRAMCMAFE